MKQAEISLPYWKQGDDLNLYMSECDSIEEALELHASSMDLGARILRQIKDAIEGHDVDLWAGAHMIQIEANNDLIDRLVEQELAAHLQYFDEETGQYFDTDEFMTKKTENVDWGKEGF